ncbi:MAG TPA: EAL domain-containing protein, partial [Burkholderiaceae bacterium]
ARLFVHPPNFSRVTHKWTWLFARRIENPDGSFAGVAYAVLDIDQVRRVLAGIRLADGGTITLRHANMEAITGRLGSSAPFPVQVGDTRLSPELKLALARTPQRATYNTTESQLGNHDQIFSYERSAKYGFYVWLGEATDVALAEWRRQVWAIGGLALAFACVSFGFLRTMGRAWRRQDRDLAAIEHSQSLLAEAQEIAGIGSLTYDFATARWSSSGIFDRIVGIDGRYPRDLKHLLKLAGRRDRAGVTQYLHDAAQRGVPFSREQTVRRKSDGERRWVQTRGRICLDNGQRRTLVCTIQDITERKRAENEIRRLAYYDVLTELPNRRLLLDRLADAMRVNHTRDRHGALMLIDLDNFKVLNDTQGHDRGDLLLKAVALRLLASVRTTDTVARLGGDEFVVLVEELSGDPAEATRHAAALGEKIRSCLSAPFEMSAFDYACTPSIGITLFGGQELSMDELTKRADTAMYQAKAAGRNAVRFFDPRMQAEVEQRLQLESDLRQALALRQLSLHFQPQVDASGQCHGAEVLLRWQHPQRGMVPPAQFIPVAEECGLILPLGAWVLASACAQLALWAHQPRFAHLTLAVNVSPRQFNQPGFVSQLLALLVDTGADPSRLKLELTEGLLLESTGAVIDTIVALKQAGVGFSLDDFGTGYCSLSYLKRLPPDQLKIDQSFVRDLPANASDAAIVRTIVALGHSLGIAVIAEGVETAAQRDALHIAGCHAYQGYLFGKPLPLAQFEDALQPVCLA